MTISDRAKASWTRILKREGSEGYVKLITGQGSVGYVDAERTGDSLVETNLFSMVTNFDINEIDGTRVKSTDLKVISDSSVTIGVNNNLKIGTVEYTILNLRPVNFAGTLAGYICQARR